MPEPSNEWITRAEAARILGLHERTVDRWANRGRIRTQSRPHPRGKLYHRDDVAVLVAELGEPGMSRQAMTPPELVPPSELLAALERERQRSDAATQLNGLLWHQIGVLQARIEQHQQLLTDLDTSRQHLEAIEAERDRLKQQLDRLPRWLRWLVNRKA